MITVIKKMEEHEYEVYPEEYMLEGKLGIDMNRAAELAAVAYVSITENSFLAPFREAINMQELAYIFLHIGMFAMQMQMMQSNAPSDPTDGGNKISLTGNN